MWSKNTGCIDPEESFNRSLKTAESKMEYQVLNYLSCLAKRSNSAIKKQLHTELAYQSLGVDPVKEINESYIRNDFKQQRNWKESKNFTVFEKH